MSELPAEPPPHAFTPAERAPLANYKAAVEAGFFTDRPGDPAERPESMPSGDPERPRPRGDPAFGP